MQDHGGGGIKPVAFCSRMLTPAEQRYAQIEKECLASVWACQQFDRFLCGLEKFKHGLQTIGAVNQCRRQDTIKMSATTNAVDAQKGQSKICLKAKYASGKDLVVADALLRSPIQTNPSSPVAEDIVLHVHMVESNLSMSPHKMAELRSSTVDDATRQSAVTHTLTGWPNYEKDVPESLKAFFNVRSLLSVSNGLLAYTDRIVIPTLLRPDILEKIHTGHQGITKCLERDMVSVWWPGITRDIKHIVGAYEHCQVHKLSQQRQPLITTPSSTGPWQRAAADLCWSQRKDCVVVVNYHSRWIEILHLSNTTSAACIAKLKDIFARFDIPTELVSDNAPQFSSS